MNSVDVAFASRSLMSEDVSACVRKLDAAARSRGGRRAGAPPPSRDPRVLTYLGRSTGAAHHPRRDGHSPPSAASDFRDRRPSAHAFLLSARPDPTLRHPG